MHRSRHRSAWSDEKVRASGEAHGGDVAPNADRGQRVARNGPPRRPMRQAVKIGDAVEREAEHQLARPRRPAERGFGLAHPLARADDPPHDIGTAPARPRRPRHRTAAAHRSATAAEVGCRRRARRGRADTARRPSASSRAGRAGRVPSRQRSRSPASNWRSADMAARVQPAERALGEVDGDRSRGARRAWPGPPIGRSIAGRSPVRPASLPLVPPALRHHASSPDRESALPQRRNL